MAAPRDKAVNGSVPHFAFDSPTNSIENDESGLAVDELGNIQNLIRLTKENLEALNAKFAGFKHPPSMYISEYEELTSKLNEFQNKEQKLLEQVSNLSINDEPSCDDTCGNVNNDDLPKLMSNTDNGPLSAIQASNEIPADGSPKIGPRSPFHSVVRAHLPNQQRSTAFKPGQTVREALSKAMKRRKLIPEMCVVYKTNNNNKIKVNWDADITTVEGEEISVEMLETFPITTSISHNFVRKTFFSLAFCECCRKLLFHGFLCKTCGYRFHQRCAAGVPALCQQVRVEDNVLRHLLASNPAAINDRITLLGSNSAAGILQPHSPPYHGAYNTRGISSLYPSCRITSPSEPASTGGRTHPPPPLAQRERSTSAPNVCYNLVNHQNDTTLLEEFASRMHSQASSSPGHVQGSLVPPQYQQNSNSNVQSSPNCSPTRTQSAQGSPTNSMRPWRPRARSADESTDKIRPPRESIEDWEIPDDEILTGPRIGSGSFGTVYRGHWHGPVAVKKLNVTDPTPAQLQAFKNEVAVLKKTRHVNILLFMGCVSKPQLTIVTQWCEGSSLYKHLHVLETKFEMLQLIDIARQTAQGMDYLHAKNIIHRDLKSNNIFLHEDLTVKIGDFGLATVKSRWSGNHQFNQPSGSILWMAPEVIRMQDPNPYTFQSDVYAFGIVLYELITGRLPYCHINNKDQVIITKILDIFICFLLTFFTPVSSNNVKLSDS
ncbi:Serine/threonine-protein kinase B-raf [Nymphon striatum]|nr:Serine/threonine-protein kinase B-raf [Nymphon striatum]